jgi:hypothetical protein
MIARRWSSVALRTSKGSRLKSLPFQQVEGVQEDVTAADFSRSISKHGQAVVVTGDRFAVDQAGAYLECVHRLDDERGSAVPSRTILPPNVRQARGIAGVRLCWASQKCGSPGRDDCGRGFAMTVWDSSGPFPTRPVCQAMVVKW